MRVVIAEDAVLLREGLARLLDEAGFEVVAAVGDGEALIRAVERAPARPVVVDVRMPPTCTDEGVRAALVAPPAVAATSPSSSSPSTSRSATPSSCSPATPGASGYLLKDRVADVGEFVEAVRRVGAGGTALDPEVVGQLLARSRRRTRSTRLTPREREVLALMAEGRSNAAIAAQLVVDRRRGREARQQHLHQARPAARGAGPPPGAGRPALPRLDRRHRRVGPDVHAEVYRDCHSHVQRPALTPDVRTAPAPPPSPPPPPAYATPRSSRRSRAQAPRLALSIGAVITGLLIMLAALNLFSLSAGRDSLDQHRSFGPTGPTLLDRQWLGRRDRRGRAPAAGSRWTADRTVHGRRVHRARLAGDRLGLPADCARGVSAGCSLLGLLHRPRPEHPAASGSRSAPATVDRSGTYHRGPETSAWGSGDVDGSPLGSRCRRALGLGRRRARFRPGPDDREGDDRLRRPAGRPARRRRPLRVARDRLGRLHQPRRATARLAPAPSTPRPVRAT